MVDQIETVITEDKTKDAYMDYDVLLKKYLEIQFELHAMKKSLDPSMFELLDEMISLNRHAVSTLRVLRDVISGKFSSHYNILNHKSTSYNKKTICTSIEP